MACLASSPVTVGDFDAVADVVEVLKNNNSQDLAVGDVSLSTSYGHVVGVEVDGQQFVVHQSSASPVLFDADPP
eukprot:12405624-Karenia_brevis.AAC.1